MAKFKLGQPVQCTGYIKKSTNHYVVLKPKESKDGCWHCYFEDDYNHDFAVEFDGLDQEIEPNEPDDVAAHECDRYVVVDCQFKGIYVGTRSVSTKLKAEWCVDEYIMDDFGNTAENEYWKISKAAPEKFAIVYYASGKKRLVPMDMIEGGQNDKA